MASNSKKFTPQIWACRSCANTSNPSASIPDLCEECTTCHFCYEKASKTRDFTKDEGMIYVRDTGCTCSTCVVCTACMRKTVKTTVMYRQESVVRTRCGRQMAASAFESLCGPELFAKMQNWELMRVCEALPGARCCPNPRCGVLACYDISEECAAADPCVAVACAECKTEFCYECTEAPHRGLTCIQNERVKAGAMEDTVKNVRDNEFVGSWTTLSIVQRRTKPCPRCNRVIEKDGGCNNMTCRECRYMFCWMCLKSSSDGAHQTCYDDMEEENKILAGLFNAHATPDSIAANIALHDTFIANYKLGITKAKERLRIRQQNAAERRAARAIRRNRQPPAVRAPAPLHPPVPVPAELLLPEDATVEFDLFGAADDVAFHVVSVTAGEFTVRASEAIVPVAPAAAPAAAAAAAPAAPAAESEEEIDFDLFGGLFGDDEPAAAPAAAPAADPVVPAPAPAPPAANQNDVMLPPQEDDAVLAPFNFLFGDATPPLIAASQPGHERNTADDGYVMVDAAGATAATASDLASASVSSPIAEFVKYLVSSPLLRSIALLLPIILFT